MSGAPITLAQARASLLAHLGRKNTAQASASTVTRAQVRTRVQLAMGVTAPFVPVASTVTRAQVRQRVYNSLGMATPWIPVSSAATRAQVRTRVQLAMGVTAPFVPVASAVTRAQVRQRVQLAMGVTAPFVPVASTVTVAQAKVRVMAAAGIVQEWTPAASTVTLDQAMVRVRNAIGQQDEDVGDAQLDESIRVALETARYQLVEERVWLGDGLTLGPLEDGTDTLVLDAQAVIGRAAALIAMSKMLPMAANLSQLNAMYLDALERRAKNRVLAAELTEHLASARRGLVSAHPWLADGLTVPELVDDSSAIVIDDEVVVRHAAAALAAAKGLPVADRLRQLALEHLAGLERRATPVINEQISAAIRLLQTERPWLVDGLTVVIPTTDGNAVVVDDEAVTRVAARLMAMVTGHPAAERLAQAAQEYLTSLEHRSTLMVNEQINAAIRLLQAEHPWIVGSLTVVIPTNDAAAVVVDDEAVTRVAARLMAMVTGHPAAERLAQAAQEYLAGRKQQAADPLLTEIINDRIAASRRSLAQEYPWLVEGLTITDLSTDGDAVTVDADAVTIATAHRVAMARGLPVVDRLAKEADDYLSGLERRAVPVVNEQINAARRTIAATHPWVMDGLPALVDLATDGDPVQIDAEAVVKTTAALMAVARGEKQAEALMRFADAYMAALDDLTPAFLTQQINVAQQQLQVEHAWLSQRRVATVTIGGGQRFAEVPAGAQHGRIEAVRWRDGAFRRPLEPGIDRAFQGEVGHPERWAWAPTTGVVQVRVLAGGSAHPDQSPALVTDGVRESDGHDPAVMLTATAGVVTAATLTASGSGWVVAPTITAISGSGVQLAADLGPIQTIEVWPMPSDAGTLEVEYMAGATTLVNDTDLLSLDPEAVATRAAYLVTKLRMPKESRDTLAVHAAYLASLRSQQGEGRVFNMAAWRTQRGN